MHRLFKGIFYLLEICGHENPSLQTGKDKPRNKERKVRVLELY